MPFLNIHLTCRFPNFDVSPQHQSSKHFFIFIPPHEGVYNTYGNDIRRLMPTSLLNALLICSYSYEVSTIISLSKYTCCYPTRVRLPHAQVLLLVIHFCCLDPSVRRRPSLPRTRQLFCEIGCCCNWRFGMVPKRVFQRPALSIECERGVQLGATVQASVSHMEGFSVMHRINGLRQSLSSIVASRAASSERYATPLVSQDSCEIKAPDTTAEQLLVASQQRVEDLLKENHRLELLCMNQAHVMQNASVQSTQSLKQRQTSATTSAVEGGGCALGHWTPKVSTNKATARLQPECADGVEKWPTSTESFFVPEDVGMAVKRLVCTAVSVVPEMGMHEGDVTGFRTDDGALKTSEVLLFVEGNLERWVRASRECVDVETAGSMVCRSLAHFESNQREWCTTLSELIKRLQKWQWLQRQTILEGERRTLALKREMELLSCEMSKAVEERAECECRCAQLERALS
uniref:Uncharacterized protein n=1 Tax=Trypanosoma vivax (strain Y486) TaxID=1055687 RepID=G0TZY1_TRYVY|nr:conserved hypothetical protein [Trypanosoma vivax Y486]